MLELDKGHPYIESLDLRRNFASWVHSSHGFFEGSYRRTIETFRCAQGKEMMNPEPYYSTEETMRNNSFQRVASFIYFYDSIFAKNSQGLSDLPTYQDFHVSTLFDSLKFKCADR